ncbi:hypothetical protein COCON_G00102240 [Conger conger]|uniref:[histone H3]-trimethyl-L-lysine(9) demethylase n=1 Tax=Conger conger TaxID=82655 RepID=A0A9Q1HZ97_CONCO|nr:hypothetical protein COCON_G00102240 [Conger conger]
MLTDGPGRSGMFVQSGVRRETDSTDRGAEPETKGEEESGGGERSLGPTQQAHTPLNLPLNLHARFSGDKQAAVCSKICTVSVSRMASDGVCVARRTAIHGGLPASFRNPVSSGAARPEPEEEEEEEDEEEEEEERKEGEEEEEERKEDEEEEQERKEKEERKKEDGREEERKEGEEVVDEEEERKEEEEVVDEEEEEEEERKEEEEGVDEEEEERKEEAEEGEPCLPPGGNPQGRTPHTALPDPELLSPKTDPTDSQILREPSVTFSNDAEDTGTSLPGEQRGEASPGHGPAWISPAPLHREGSSASPALSANYPESLRPEAETISDALGDTEEDLKGNPVPAARAEEACPGPWANGGDAVSHRSSEPSCSPKSMTVTSSPPLQCSLPTGPCPATLSLSVLAPVPGPVSQMPSLTPEVPDEPPCPPPARDMPSLTPAVGEGAEGPLLPGDQGPQDPAAPVLSREVATPAGLTGGVVTEALVHGDCDDTPIGLYGPAVQVQVALPVIPDKELYQPTEARELQTLTPVLCDANTTPLDCNLDLQDPATTPTLLMGDMHALPAPLAGSAANPTENNGLHLSEETTKSAGSLPHWGVEALGTESGIFRPGIWDSLNSQGPAVLIENVHPEFPVLLAEDKDGDPYGLSPLRHCAWNRVGLPETESQRPVPLETSPAGGLERTATDVRAAPPSPGTATDSGAAEAPSPRRELTTLAPVAWETTVLGESSPPREEDTDTELSTPRGEETSSESTDPDSGDAELEPGEICANPSQLVIKMGRRRVAKSWRRPLKKPTARATSSVVRQQSASDEEYPDLSLTNEEGQEAEPWAKPLLRLWRNRKPNFFAEREYNAAVARMEPYCAVCTLFMPYYKPGGTVEESRVVVEEVPGSTKALPGLRTKPLIPEVCFWKRESGPPSAPLEEAGPSPLISCRRCCVKVHASCYGVPAHDVCEDWSCDRCVNGDITADCCLCNLRGGALKQTTDNKWAHVICAVAIPEVRFGNEEERVAIDISRIPPQRYKLKCVYCRKRIKKVWGACVQCSCGRCLTSFHVTCAHATGVTMEPDDWPHVVFVTCHRHQSRSPTAKSNACKKDIVLGQTVITKHKNLRYYGSRVTHVMAQTFYEVVFDDGSFSNDTFPEDIVSRDCVRLGPPAEGEEVQVKWPDGLFYGAKYLGSNTSYMYQVEFEDGSQVMAKREDVYTLDEDLPKKVKGRLSTASCMRFRDAFHVPLMEGEAKRQRVPNSRFQKDYVAHLGCRAASRGAPEPRGGRGK